jgi:hypothetical protein
MVMFFYRKREPMKNHRKRVAICLRGAVSKQNAFFKQNEIYLDQPYVDYKKCARSIMKYIVEPNQSNYDFDFFCHGWNQDLEQDMLELYHPKKYLFENNNDYADYINSLCQNEDDFGCVSQALTMKKVIELKEQYEKENKYDIVILYRYDVLLWKPLLLNEYNSSNIYVNAQEDGNGDFHFIMNEQNANQFKYLIDSIQKGNQCKMHFWIKNYINNYMKKNLVLDRIVPGRDQEVIRKIQEFSIQPGYLSQEQYDSI